MSHSPPDPFLPTTERLAAFDDVMSAAAAIVVSARAAAVEDGMGTAETAAHIAALAGSLYDAPRRDLCEALRAVMEASGANEAGKAGEAGEAGEAVAGAEDRACAPPLSADAVRESAAFRALVAGMEGVVTVPVDSISSMDLPRLRTYVGGMCHRFSEETAAKKATSQVRARVVGSVDDAPAMRAVLGAYEETRRATTLEHVRALARSDHAPIRGCVAVAVRGGRRDGAVGAGNAVVRASGASGALRAVDAAAKMGTVVGVGVSSGDGDEGRGAGIDEGIRSAGMGAGMGAMVVGENGGVGTFTFRVTSYNVQEFVQVREYDIQYGGKQSH